MLDWCTDWSTPFFSVHQCTSPVLGILCEQGYEIVAVGGDGGAQVIVHGAGRCTVAQAARLEAEDDTTRLSHR